MYFKRILIIIAVFCIAACGKKNFRQSSDMPSVMHNAEAIQILPMKAEVYTVDIAGSEERMHNYEYFLEAEASEIFKNALESKGYRVTTLKKKDIKDKNIYREIDGMTNKYQEENKRIYGSYDTFDAEYALNIETNLGEHSKAILEVTDNPIAAISFFSETVQTSGAQARDFAFSIALAAFGGGYSSNSEAATLNLALVDLEKNKILWSNNAVMAQTIYGSMWDSFSDEQDVARDKLKFVVEKALEELPDKSKLFDE